MKKNTETSGCMAFCVRKALYYLGYSLNELPKITRETENIDCHILLPIINCFLYFFL